MTSGLASGLLPPCETATFANTDVDLAITDFERSDGHDSPDFVKSVKRLSILENVADLRLGEDIGAMGYACGSELHVDAKSEGQRF
jgi:hypothetical protein